MSCTAAAGSAPPFEVRFGTERFRLTGGFNTQTGIGTGSLSNGGPGTMQWRFVDGGAGGANDSAQLTIKDAGGATVFAGTSAPPAGFPGSSQPTGSNTVQAR